MDYIYDGELRDTRDFASDEPLFVNHCGFSYNKNLAVIREKGRHDFHIIYVISGECKVEIDGKSETMRENGFAIYFPGQRQYYQDKKCKRYWIHFSGVYAESLLEKYGFEAKVYQGRENPEIKDLLREMSEEYLFIGEKSIMKNVVLLQMLILRLHESITSEEYINPAVSGLVKQVNNDCRETVDIKMYADKARMGEESFCHLFRKSMGIPLHKYVTRVRMKEAVRLLKYSSISISQIAYEVGYDDPLYFSRIFKKYYGVSPKFMRNNQG